MDVRWFDFAEGARRVGMVSGLITCSPVYISGEEGANLQRCNVADIERAIVRLLNGILTLGVRAGRT